MGGYGLYVWGSYLATFICVIGEILMVKRSARTLRQQLSLTKESILRERKDEATS
ncbi:MAG TPA: heme exporter protein CcmD [Nitrosomonas sp.]|nr:heme exporter protein CcmD [Nitrosomonas sp.]HMW19668.1 heme exporter protein CcmD [Nitrosomonas sp.]HMW67972.1 heme exporter protein CcmD [Nitrosomonas sp.]HMY60447.1 heme exporter protein CcmD [Nitrosomonas sp.]HMY89387.1 heme exporter protein CcmD [Nitrosomonas sp.]